MYIVIYLEVYTTINYTDGAEIRKGNFLNPYPSSFHHRTTHPLRSMWIRFLVTGFLPGSTQGMHCVNCWAFLHGDGPHS